MILTWKTSRTEFVLDKRADLFLAALVEMKATANVTLRFYIHLKKLFCKVIVYGLHLADRFLKPLCREQ